MLRKTMVGVAALVFCAAPLAAQEAGGQAEGQVAADAFARAEAAGIPTSLLESKLAEGKAKGVAMARIEAAIERRTDALIRASETFTEAGVQGASEADLSVAADAIEGGVSAEVLQAVSTKAPRERRAVAIAALTHLVAEGVVDSEALVRVEAALDRGPDALADLTGQVGVGMDGRASGDVGRGDVGADGRGQVGVDVGAGIDAEPDLR